MRNIVDLEMDELLGEGLSNILEVPLLEKEDLTDFFFAFLDFIDNTFAKSLDS
jgi:hypothetical protein